MIEVGDGRGQERSAKSRENRAAIIDFFKDNPGSTKTQCATTLGVSIVTVSRHVKAINGAG